MALVNVAAELARQGRRVLAVDFDLEAPGLDTFDLLRTSDITPGLVDFVGEYLVTGQAPDVNEFVFESPGAGSDAGGLWVMPSGAHRDSYATTLANIDWGELYDRHDGYLLFEDLKAQWKECLDPDYVLIDSRTGHTDVGGICTRQLPDAVAILFFPNAQNLRGLEKVVRDIRSEDRGSDPKAIALHFIMSNVPDLDDEDRILEKSISSFEKGLEFRDPLIIHRYDSLSLLNQVIFTKDRPRSRLAKEYHSVLADIIRENPLDRHGVLDYLKDIRPSRRFSRDPESWFRKQMQIEKRFEEIEKNHRNDGEVLFRLGQHPQLPGGDRKAFELFDLAIDAGYSSPEAYIRRANARWRGLDDFEGARQDAKNVMNFADASAFEVDQAVRILGARDVGTEDIEDLASLPRLTSRPLQELAWIASRLNTSRSEAKVAFVLLRPLIDEGTLSADDARGISEARNELIFSSIATGNFSYAIRAILDEEREVEAMTIQSAFNYGMAIWGEYNRIDPRPFERAWEWYRSHEDDHRSANNLQCMAVASWVAGENRSARYLAGRAKEKIQKAHSRGRQEVSCWRYLKVSVKEFEQDVDEIVRLIGGDQDVKPRFKSNRTE